MKSLGHWKSWLLFSEKTSSSTASFIVPFGTRTLGTKGAKCLSLGWIRCSLEGEWQWVKVSLGDGFLYDQEDQWSKVDWLWRQPKAKWRGPIFGLSWQRGGRNCSLGTSASRRRRVCISQRASSSPQVNIRCGWWVLKINALFSPKLKGCFTHLFFQLICPHM